MSQGTKKRSKAVAVESGNAEVISMRAGLDERSPLDDLVRAGAQKMLQAALENEVELQ